MPPEVLTAQFRAMDKRRLKLGMSRAVVARKAGLSQKTVERILSGRDLGAGYANVAAVAYVLGFALSLRPSAKVIKIRREQARRKAQRLVGFVQGTSALEGQALDPDTLDEMVDRTTHELLVGSRRKLWTE